MIIVVDIILTLLIALVWSFHSTGSQLKFMTSTSFAWFFSLREERERGGGSETDAKEEGVCSHTWINRIEAASSTSHSSEGFRS